MSESEVLDLFRRAVADDDPVAMRAGLDRVLGLSSGTGLSAEEEYRVRHPDYVMEMPQSGERIRGREAMRAMQEAFPTPPPLTVRDRKSTRLNSSHANISYAVFCLKKKKYQTKCV